MIEQLPVLPLRSLTIFPNTSISIDVSRKMCVNAIKFAVDNKLKIVTCCQIDPECDNPLPEDLFSVGTLVDINKILKIDEDTYRILVDGLCVVDLVQFHSHNDFMVANVEERASIGEMSEIEFIANKTYILKTFDTLINKFDKMYPKHIRSTLEQCNDKNILVNLASGIVTQATHKQKLLSENDINKKYELLCDMLSDELIYTQAVYNIEKKVQNKISNSNKEYLLREQIKSIQEELGEGEDDVYTEYMSKIEELNADDSIKNKLKKDLDRYNRMNESAPESAIIRNYLDWALELPWNNMTADSNNMQAVIEQLNKDHYGIDKVKKRIVEYLAVRLMTNGASKGAVLCLVGPPGVGKTSICKSIATALNKEFVQLTLGGVHDEAEIRGHRKTYIGAMPGRILSNLAKSESNNPLFLLDEVDKITRDTVKEAIS
ncbi:MAG: LON peptidase substrate-binding domain-containing protein, partial [Clostridia bacterium]|nr:LON peptidase substrate-binding domain-containing protein [Clostridia bacterium]